MIASTNSRQDVVPASVRTLDDLLNRRIATAQDSAAVDRWLRIKGDVKRRLVGVPADCLEQETIDAIDAIRRQVSYAA